MADEFPESLRQRLERRERELAAIRSITAALHARTNPDDLVRQTLDTAVETVDAADGTIFLHEPENNKLVFKYVVGADADRLTGREIDADKGIVGQVFATGAGRITADPRADAHHFDEIDKEMQRQTQNIVTVPLKAADGHPIGAMQVLNRNHGTFDEQDLAVLEVLSSQAASAIETARLHQEAKLAQVIHLIGDISHDVKNMVTPIVTGAQTLEFMVEQMWTDLDAALAEATPECTERVRQAVAGVRVFFPEALEMTLDGTTATQERVREIADAVKGIVAEPQFQPADINEIVEQVVKTLTFVAERADVDLIMELGEVPLADLDPKRIYNALYNLINNAIPETPRGGRVYVRTAAVDVDGDGELDHLQVVIADTGRGMPEHIRRRLFTDQAVSTKVGGTGLGTRIVKNVVDAHRGSITVESEPGRGTTFTMRLPLRQEDQGSGIRGQGSGNRPN